MESYKKKILKKSGLLPNPPHPPDWSFIRKQKFTTILLKIASFMDETNFTFRPTSETNKVAALLVKAPKA